jgi:predicted enzyme related to lactoylglutathione lyase
MASPVILFEIVANNREALLEFYTKVFDWQDEGRASFAFIRFPPAPRPLFGIIANATPGKPGWEKGVTFYIQVGQLLPDESGSL